MKHPIKKTLTTTVTVLGSLILFLSWVFQQTLLEEANSTLQQIHDAKTVYQTYQSNNAMFNAISQTTSDKNSIDQIRRYQEYNYELGLQELEQVLDKDEKRGIPKAPRAYDTSQDVSDLLNVTQVRLEALQERLITKEDEIERRKSTLNRIFLAIYAVGSVTILAGSVLGALASADNS